jgi:hypothetical protein
MVDQPGKWTPVNWTRASAHALLGRSYTLSRRYALWRMARRRESPIVLLSMGKTGSTAIAHAVQEATARPVFQVFRLEPARLREAEQRYRERQAKRSRGARSRGDDDTKRNPFPGAHHLWESDHLLRHPPAPESPWTVITTVREPVAQAVSAYFHAARRSGALADSPTVKDLTDRFVSEHWLRAPQRWFDREFGTAVGIDAFAQPFDPGVGHGIVETPAVRLLLLRLESFGCAPSVLAAFLGLAAPVAVARRNDGASGPFAPVYREFLAAAALPARLLDEAYDSRYAQHFYTPGEIAQFRHKWSKR